MFLEPEDYELARTIASIVIIPLIIITVFIFRSIIKEYEKIGKEIIKEIESGTYKGDDNNSGPHHFM
jgi:hypothetical protein